MRARASVLEPIAAIASGDGPIQVSPASRTARAKSGVLGQEAVAGVDRRRRRRGARPRRSPRRRGTPRGSSPSATATSASRTNGASASGSVKTAAVPMPSRAARARRRGGRSRRGWRRATPLHHIRKTPKPSAPLTSLLWTTRQREAEHRARVARVDDRVVVAAAGVAHSAVCSASICASTAARIASRCSSSTSCPRAFGGRARDDVEHAGELRGPHHRRLRVRPREHEARVVAAAAHRVVGRAVGAADDHARGAGPSSSRPR